MWFLKIFDILNKLLTNNKIQFYIYQGDITARKNCTEALKNKIQSDFLKNNRYFNLPDIYQIVHLVDLDAIFLDENKIKEDITCNHGRYENGYYIAKDKKQILMRNLIRANNIRDLITCNYLKIKSHKILYNIYYFSCHLEHVLHNSINVEDKEKRKLSEAFSNSFFKKENEFLKFINDKEFSTQLTYQDSWKDAIKEEHALRRGTNFNLFFKDI